MSKEGNKRPEKRDQRPERVSGYQPPAASRGI